MQVGQILKTKVHGKLFSVLSGSILNDAVMLLSSERIGSVVVLGENDTLVGIFSERDTIRALATRGANCLDEQVNQFMTKSVETCNLTDQGNEVLTRMTEGRFRHMPVMEDGALVGIITIGDIVKLQLDTLLHENEAMQNMIRGH
jgi:CBS domain-containing protein|tara:strand:- start:317 stop:751 length:435 start_codon:yes stop_codon:yes gene_type:complete